MAEATAAAEAARAVAALAPFGPIPDPGRHKT